MMSIRLRFFIVSVISVTLALSLAAWFLVTLFADNYGRRIDAELTSHVNRLASVLEFDAAGNLQTPESPADNRFYQAYGGLYWQIYDTGRSIELRSPSLFDYVLPLPEDGHPPGAIHRYRLPGPEGSDVIVQERSLVVAAPGGSRLIRIAVALDANVLDTARSEFARAILPFIAALAAFLVLMSVLQLKLGLLPLSKVARDLDDVRERRSHSLPGPYPAELSGLVDQLNRLIDAQARTIEKARARAGDLAHGLKTPLTVIANNAYTLREKGETEMADELDHLAGSMLAHVEHELALARIANSPDLRSGDAGVGKIASDIIRTLKRTEAGERLNWRAEIPEDLMLPIDPHDCRELLGNLLENASKWAGTAVEITARAIPGGWRLTIEDDGPGVAEDKIGDLTRRGVRFDHQTPGTGLGLSIVKEICDVYGLGLALENRQAGGLRATVDFSASR
jgi:signal transduction histidine kinase